MAKLERERVLFGDLHGSNNRFDGRKERQKAANPSKPLSLALNLN